jgi:hypothetical protein
MLSAQATNLIISEYVEGSSYQKAIEIFNGTGAPIDLSTVSLKKQTNGAGAFGSELVLSGTLASNDVFVIVNSTTGGTNLVGQPYVDLATNSQAVNFNGNDAVALFRNGVMIDVVGIVDQVENWGLDVTWVRNSNVASPTTTFNMNEWTEYPNNTFSYLGTHTFTGGSTDPVIIVSNPNAAVTWYVGHTYNIEWSSANVTGNVKIEISNDGVLSTLAASIENSGSWTWNIPEDYTLGTHYKIKVSNLDGTVSDMSDNFFSIAVLPVTDFTSISQLRAANPDGTTIYRVTSEVFLTYKQTYRNKKYFQDASGAIEVDDLAGIVTTQYQIGDGVQNIIGTLNAYHNLLQFVPFANFPPATSSGNEVIPTMVTIEELNNNFENYESQLVQIISATFLDTSAPFATGTNYFINDGTGQIIFRTNFFEANYIGQPIPTGQNSMKVITTQYDAAYQVTARSLADFGPVSNDDDYNVLEPISLIGNYPNPFNPETTIAVSVKTPQAFEIEIFNTKGQLIRTLKSDVATAGKQNLVWNAKDNSGKPVSAGIYFYNIKGGRFTSTKKMILLK